MRILVLLCLVVAVSGDGSALNTWTRGGMRLRGGWGEDQGAKPNIRVVQSFTEQPKRPPGWTDDREGAPRTNTHQAPGQGGLKLSQPTVGTKFTYRGPNARSVEVAGSWSDFKNRVQMKAIGGGAWEVEIPDLPVGRHELKFVVNGNQWVCSDSMPKSRDIRGNENNLVLVMESDTRPNGGHTLGTNGNAQQIRAESPRAAARSMAQNSLSEPTRSNGAPPVRATSPPPQYAPPMRATSPPLRATSPPLRATSPPAPLVAPLVGSRVGSQPPQQQQQQQQQQQRTPTPPRQEVAPHQRQVFVASSSTITSARSSVSQLEEEKRRAEDRLARAQAQLVETMMEQLSQGITALDKRGADLSAYAAESKRGIKDVQASHVAKIQQIKQHAASLRAVLDKKEAASIQAVTQVCQERVEVLENALSNFDGTLPQLTDAIQNAKTALATGKGKPELFVEHAQILIGEMAILSEKSSMLESPAIDVDFNKVQYEEQGVKKDLLI